MPKKSVSLKELDRKETEKHKEKERKEKEEERKEKFPPTDPIVVDVLVVGDQTFRLSTLLTELEQRNTHVTYLGISRMTQLFCDEKNYWINVNFVSLDEYLMDPFLINTATEPYNQVIVTYTWGNDQSLRKAKKLIQMLATKDGVVPKARGGGPKEGPTEVNVTMDDESILALPEPPLAEKIGPGILVGVNTKAYVKGEEDGFPQKPENPYEEKDSRLPDEAHNIAGPYGPALYLGEEDVDAVQDVYAWIFETFVKVKGSSRVVGVQKYKSAKAPPEERAEKYIVDAINSLISSKDAEETKGRRCNIQ